MAALVALLVIAAGPRLAAAGGGLLGLDHEWSLDERGIWSRNYQMTLEYGAAAIAAGGALWLGNDDRLGHTLWQSADASLLSAIAAQGLKYAFSRARPTQGNNPDAWFRGGCCQSFPSGEVTLQAAFVTPIVLQYAEQRPWVWGLEALPLYDSIARLKSQAHWQSDVLAGWALGSGFGYVFTRFRIPLLVRLLPGGMTVGLYTHL
jgi:undecaprenyl-diphosphatase